MIIKGLYHGSEEGIRLPIWNSCTSSLCDFGRGFYLYDDENQAKNKVCLCKPDGYYAGMIHEVELDLSGLKVYEFTDDILWALYVGVNRGRLGKEYNRLMETVAYINSFDVVIGHIADDKISRSFNGFMNGNLTETVLKESLKLVNYGKQYVVKTSKGSKNIDIVVRHILRREDKVDSLRWGINVKREIDEATEVVKLKHRRTGLYIDEILEAWR